MYVDSHLHFDAFDEEGDVDAVVGRARAAGVERMIAVGGSAESNRRAIRLAETHAGCIFATAGYDRDMAGAAYSLSDLDDALRHPRVVAVGETGLDYHHGADTAAAQREVFAAMLDRAGALLRPVVVHSREADEDTLTLLREHRDRFRGKSDRLGVLHCFTGSAAFARKLLDLGLCIGFSGIVTFKNAAPLREVAKTVPLDRLLIETDAPYLAPEPHRGRRNEPAYVVRVAETLAEIRHDTVERIADSTALNAIRLFALGEPWS